MWRSIVVLVAAAVLLVGIACQGERGFQGEQGATGQAGQRGQSGPQGEAGARGAAGETGYVGPMGPAGQGGPSGPTGPAGSRGMTGPAGPKGASGADSPEPLFTLQLLHAADMDGTTGALSNVENFSAILDGFRRQFPENTLVLSSGDNYIPGPRYFAASDDANEAVLGISGEGRGDIALLNAMGFQASALGNHELDRGTASFASQIAHEESDGGAVYYGARFPYLSSNLSFADDENLAPLVVADGQEAMLAAGSLARSAVITVGGQRIGIVGATTPWLASLTIAGDIAVLPGDRAGPAELATAIQPVVDALTEQGIDKVILLAHMQQIAVEQELATLLRDVDIIVAGGSNSLLADETDRLWPGDEAKDDYPLQYRSASGDPVLLVNTDADYKYVGRLVVKFDETGVVLPDTIDPHQSGAYATNPQGGHRFAGTPIAGVTAIAQSLRQVLVARDGNVFGAATVFLDGRRGSVRTEETNLGNLTADANLWTARRVDPEVAISIKNGGGIRDNIGLIIQPPGSNDPSMVQYLPPQANPDVGKAAGAVSQFDIEGALRFNNDLVIMELTAAQLKQVIEHSVGFDGVGQVTAGQFPQVSGMRFSFDPGGPIRDRIRSLAIVGDNGEVTDRVVRDGEVAGDPSRAIKIVTLGFLAEGGDGYPFPSPAPGRIDLVDALAGNGQGQAEFAKPGTEQDALAEYLAAHYTEQPYATADSPPEQDRRIQNLGLAGVADTVFGEYGR